MIKINKKLSGEFRSAIATAGHKFRTLNISKTVRKIVISPIKEMSILALFFHFL